MRSEQPHLCGISLDFARIPPKQNENFQMNTRKWVSPARWDRVFFNQLCFVFQMLIKWHGVKVGPGPREPGNCDPNPPSKFKSGIRDPPKV